jgi:hypothetical protein|nr:hypothetical protein [Clostridia bacterium]
MRKLTFTILVVLLLLSATGCSKYKDGGLSDVETNTFEGVTMEIDESTVTPVSLKASVINELEGYEVESGNEYVLSLEKLEDDGWHKLVLKDDLVTTSEAYGFGKGKTAMECVWDSTYGPLPEGHYRVIKVCWTYESDGEGSGSIGEDFYLSGEFDID